MAATSHSSLNTGQTRGLFFFFSIYSFIYLAVVGLSLDLVP